MAGVLAASSARLHRRAETCRCPRRDVRCGSRAVEPVRSHGVVVPRLTGSGNTGTLVIVHLVKPGTRVKRGDLLIEFDRQAQMKAANDRQAEYRDFVEQINRKRGEQLTAGAHGEAELKIAENAVKSAELEVQKKRRRAADHRRAEPADAGRGAREARAAAPHLRPASKGRRRGHARAGDPARPREERGEATRKSNADKMRVAVADRRHGGAQVHVEERRDGRGAGRRRGARRPRRCSTSSTRAAMRVRAKVNQADITGAARRRRPRAHHPRLVPVARRSAAGSSSSRRSARPARCRTASARFSRSSASTASDPHLMPDLAAAIDVGEPAR